MTFRIFIMLLKEQYISFKLKYKIILTHADILNQ